MSHNPIPKKVDLTEQEFIDLENEIRRSDLSEKSRDLVIKSLHFMTWLQNSIGHAKVSIKKLQKLFGILPSKRKKNAHPRRNKPHKGLRQTHKED